jgi:hypothetical protein
VRWQVPHRRYRHVQGGRCDGHVPRTSDGMGGELVGIYDKSSNWIANVENSFMLFKRPVAPGAEPEGPWSKVWTMDHVAQAMASLPRWEA